MDRSPGFGSIDCNCCALFRLAFATAPGLRPLTLLQPLTRRSVLQKVRRQAHRALRLIVSARFQVLFHSPSGVLFTFPSRYWFTIGRQEYLALECGHPSFLRDFTCPTVLKDRSSPPILFAYRAITFCGATFQWTSTKDVKTVCGTQPTVYDLATFLLQRLCA